MSTSINKNIDDLSKNCRLCLKIGKNIRNIFNDNDKKWAMTDISQLIYECTNIEVTVNDATTGICLLCYKQITSIVSFRKRCARINDLLKRQRKQDVKSTITSNNDNKGHLNIENIPSIDLSDEVSSVPALWEKNANFGEISDYEMPSPDLCESDDQIDHSALDDLEKNHQLDVTDAKYNESEDNSRMVLPKSRCKMKDPSKQSQNYLDDWPKLKKRDLVETKAYRGLCHLCGKEYQHLWVHLQSHSEVPTETCDICGKGFRSKANLSLHILLHKDADMPCEVCGKKYRTKMRLKRHMRVHTQNRPFFCNICQKRFYTKYNLEVHGRIHSGERPFLCSAKNCNERFAHSYALKHHMDKVHKH